MSQKKPLVVYGGSLAEIASSDQVHPQNLGTGTRDGTTFLRDDGAWAATGAGSGSVSSFLFTNANGVTGTVTTATTTPTLLLALADITPTSIVTGAVTSNVNLSSTAVTITQTGSGKALVVTGDSSFSGSILLGITAAVYTGGGTVNTTSTTVLDSFSATVYRSAKYQIQVSDGTNHETMEMYIIHDGTTVFLTSYGNVFTSTTLGYFDASLTANVISVTYTASAATPKIIKFVRSMITV